MALSSASEGCLKRVQLRALLTEEETLVHYPKVLHQVFGLQYALQRIQSLHLYKQINSEKCKQALIKAMTKRPKNSKIPGHGYDQTKKYRKLASIA